MTDKSFFDNVRESICLPDGKHSRRFYAIARYMALKGVNVGSGNYDVMIETWDDALAEYDDDRLIDMCAVAAMKPGGATLHEFLKATDEWLENRYRMRGQ